jgi:glucose/arabinose dehydrogenase
MRIPARALLTATLIASCDDDANRAATVDASVDATTKDVAVDIVDAVTPSRVSCRGKGTVSGVWLKDSHYCLELYASGLSQARQMAFAPNGDLFVKAGISVFALSDADKDGLISPSEVTQFAAPTTGTTHGVAISNGYVYASSDTTVVRYTYKDGDKVATGPEEVVVQGMPSLGHYTRTLAFDSQGRLYVNVGSFGNVDTTPEELALRSMVRRFTVSSIPAGGLDYATGEVWAYGLRNEVGIAIDSQDHVWSVENGRDDIYDNQFGTIGNDNPAEEINRLDAPGPRFFGYPYCWTEWLVDGGLGPGTSWGDDEMGGFDTYCKDTTQVQRAAFALQAHAAPLGVAVYESDSFPFRGDLVIGEHGSSYRTPAIGRMLVHAVVGTDGNIKSVEPLVGQSDGDGGLQQGVWDARPVDVRVGPDGAIYFSDDLGGRVFRLGYTP